MSYRNSSRHGGNRGRPLLVLLIAFCLVPSSWTAPLSSAGRSAAVDQEAMSFVRELLSQRPAKEFSIFGTFRVRQADGTRIEIPVSYAIHLTETKWQSVYQTGRTTRFGPEALVVIHNGVEPSRYRFTQTTLDGARTNSMVLEGGEANVSFAGTDFWLSDLGMEFLHWPQQRFVRDAKITMRFGRPCKVVESINPRPTESNYSRVISWVDSELGSVIRAEAYDLQGRRLKFFSLKSFKKVNGHWQVKDMEILNDRTDTRTVLEFHFEAE